MTFRNGYAGLRHPFPGAKGMRFLGSWGGNSNTIDDGRGFTGTKRDRADFKDDVHATNDLAELGIERLAIETGSLAAGADKKLAAISVSPGVSHRHDTGFIAMPGR